MGMCFLSVHAPTDPSACGTCACMRVCMCLCGIWQEPVLPQDGDNASQPSSSSSPASSPPGPAGCAGKGGIPSSPPLHLTAALSHEALCTLASSGSSTQALSSLDTSSAECAWKGAGGGGGLGTAAAEMVTSSSSSSGSGGGGSCSSGGNSSTGCSSKLLRCAPLAAGRGCHD